MALEFPQSYSKVALPRGMSRDISACVVAIALPGGKDSQDHGERCLTSFAWDIAARGRRSRKWWRQALLRRSRGRFFLFSDHTSVHETALASNIGLAFWHGQTLLARYPVAVNQTSLIMRAGTPVCISRLACLLYVGDANKCPFCWFSLR